MLGEEEGRTDIGKFTIFENHKIELVRKLDKLVREFKCKVFNNVTVCLAFSQLRSLFSLFLFFV